MGRRMARIIEDDYDSDFVITVNRFPPSRAPDASQRITLNRSGVKLLSVHAPLGAPIKQRFVIAKAVRR